MSTRIPAVAGSFYPSEVRDLKNMINDFMETAKYPHIDGKLKGLIVPHAGYTYSGGIAALGYKLLKEKVKLDKKEVMAEKFKELFEKNQAIY